MAEFTPDDIPRKQFRTSFRGFDAVEVRQYLETLASAVSDLVAERDQMASKLSEAGERDLKSEFESIGREVTAVLETARTPPINSANVRRMMQRVGVRRQSRRPSRS